ncbi:MAG: hypothetical protein Q9195_007533 [Heterodermia aff. obscurata]
MKNGFLSLQKTTSRLTPSLQLLDAQLIRNLNGRHLSTRLSKHDAVSHRASGTRAVKIYHSLCRSESLPKPRQATVRTLYDPSDPSQKLDANALILYFPAPRTATGEDVLEFHVHGGNAVVKAVLAAISRTCLPKIRYAEPGEFTRRAFYNNRLDLTEVEALGDTLSAETEQQRQLAVRGFSNALGERYENWRQQLLYARGELEALIDFSEDQQFDDTPDILLASVVKQVEKFKVLLQKSIKNAFRGELLRKGIRVALVGAPNVGKSSLLNRIVRREAAIVSEEAGTTRDVVEVGVDIGGFYCVFGDLAGLRTSSDTSLPVGKIELEGMRRARERALEADIVVVMLCIEDKSEQVHIPSEVEEVLQKLDKERQDVIYVINKTDLLPPFIDHENTVQRLKQSLARDNLPSSQQPFFMVSCIDQQGLTDTHRTSHGIQNFMAGLVQVFQSKTSAILPNDVDSSGLFASNETWADSIGASERHRVLLQQCLSHLENFLAGCLQIRGGSSGELETAHTDVVVAAENLRNAAVCLAKITGKGEGGDVEEVLGVVFEKSAV